MEDNNKNSIYTYTIEKQTNNMQKIIIQFNREYLEDLYSKEEDKIKNNVVIRGFRPGKIPQPLLKKLFQKDFIKSKIMEMLSDISKEIIKKEKIKPLNEEFVLYKKENIDNIIESDYKIELEIPIIPDFSSINFEDITIEKERQKITEEQIEGFIEKEKLRNSKLIPKQQGISEKNDVLEISYNLYEIEQYETPQDNKPTISKELTSILLTDTFIKDFSKLELNNYNLEMKDIVGLEKGTFKKITVTKNEDNIIKKAYLDLWIKNILAIDKEQSMETVLKLWNVTDTDALKRSVKEFLNDIEEFEAKMQMFRELLNIIIEKYKVDIDYPPEIEKSVARIYLEDFVSAAHAQGIPPNIIEKQLQKFSTSDKNYLLYKLEMLLTNFFLETDVKPTEEDILKTYSFIVKKPSYYIIRETLLKNANLVKFIIQKFYVFKTIDKILSKIKVKEETSTSIIIQ